VEKEAAAARMRVVVKKGKDPVKGQVVDTGNQVVSPGLLFPAMSTKEALRAPGAPINDKESVLKAIQQPILEVANTNTTTREFG
jgi:hypothetical protein